MWQRNEYIPSYYSPVFCIFTQYLPGKKTRSPRQRRAEIRSRAYGSGAESTRGRRHRRVGKRIPEDDEMARSAITPRKGSKSGREYYLAQEGN